MTFMLEQAQDSHQCERHIGDAGHQAHGAHTSCIGSDAIRAIHKGVPQPTAQLQDVEEIGAAKDCNGSR